MGRWWRREADLDRVANDEHADTLRCITEDAKSKSAVHHVFQGATPPGQAVNVTARIKRTHVVQGLISEYRRAA
jgi:hypothetical protein